MRARRLGEMVARSALPIHVGLGDIVIIRSMEGMVSRFDEWFDGQRLK